MPLVKVASRQLTLSNLDKVFYPRSGFTKGQVIDYYSRIAPVILHYLKGRPVTLKRYPNGVEGKFFYEKRCPSHRPEWIRTLKLWSETNRANIFFCTIDKMESLVWVANLASIELHVLLSQEKKLEQPTMMAFDLDPGEPADVLDCIAVALRLRDLLGQFDLQAFPKTSGSKGLHVLVPLNTPATFDATKSFAHATARMLEKEDPKRVVSKMSKALRKGKVFVDWSQNDSHKTTVCAYSLRAREQPTVSTPVSWDELEQIRQKKDPARLAFQTEDVLERVQRLGDLMRPVLKLKQRLPKTV